jgi:mRNA-degrading endonuclease RelE of RelBE toxin-antitoxin system
MAYEILLAPEAVEDLGRLTARDRATVKDAIERYLRFEPTKVSRSRIKRLRGLEKPQYRLRVNELRVFYDVSDAEDVVEVLAIIAKEDVDAWLQKNSEETEGSGPVAGEG